MNETMNESKWKHRTKRKRQIAALCTCLVFIIIMAASFLYIIENQKHNCTGEHCGICHEMQICDGNVKNCILESMAVFFGLLILCDTLLSLSAWSLKNEEVTLVTLKVKLSN